MPPQEQAELWMALRDRMTVDWKELTTQEKKACEYSFLKYPQTREIPESLLFYNRSKINIAWSGRASVERITSRDENA